MSECTRLVACWVLMILLFRRRGIGWQYKRYPQYVFQAIFEWIQVWLGIRNRAATCGRSEQVEALVNFQCCDSWLGWPRLSDRRQPTQRYIQVAITTWSLEEPPSCLQISPPRVCIVVHSGRHVLGMESVQSYEFSFMGLWKTSVSAQLLPFCKDWFFPFIAGAGKSVFWYV